MHTPFVHMIIVWDVKFLIIKTCLHCYVFVILSCKQCKSKKKQQILNTRKIVMFYIYVNISYIVISSLRIEMKFA